MALLSATAMRRACRRSLRLDLSPERWLRTRPPVSSTPSAPAQVIGLPLAGVPTRAAQSQSRSRSFRPETRSNGVARAPGSRDLVPTPTVRRAAAVMGLAPVRRLGAIPRARAPGRPSVAGPAAAEPDRMPQASGQRGRRRRWPGQSNGPARPSSSPPEVGFALGTERGDPFGLVCTCRRHAAAQGLGQRGAVLARAGVNQILGHLGGAG